MVLKQYDFIEIEYTGRIKESTTNASDEQGLVFDTTDVVIAKKNAVKPTQMPVIICLGDGEIVRGLDNFLVGKDLGTYSVDVSCDDAFGRKDAKLLQLVPMKQFEEQRIRPMPGLRLNIDGNLGTVRAVSGGRIIVDFNHPLASKDVHYEITVKRVLTDAEEKLRAWVKRAFGPAEVKVQGTNATVTVPSGFPLELAVPAAKHVGDRTGLTVTFVQANPVEKK